MRINLFIIITILLQLTCYRTDHDIVNLNNNTIEILGHAGMGISNSYPINSFESTTYALALGADGTEIDIQLTSDNVLVAYHDQFLESSTHKSGSIRALKWAEVKDAHYTTTPYHDYKIASLETIFEHTEHLRDYRFALDCKLYQSNNSPSNDSIFLQRYASAIVNILTQYNLPSKTIIESADSRLFSYIRNQTGDYQLFLTTNDIITSLDLAEQQELDGFTIRDNNAPAEDIATAHERGFQVALFNTLTKKENIDAVEKNPDMIQTDKLKHLIKVLK